jgi:rSAM/selenodomain-associated transferase 2
MNNASACAKRRLTRPVTCLVATTDGMTPDLSVIIPALNAAVLLPGTLAALGSVPEVVVVDGGSTDGTVAIAVASGARVLTAARGRGTQIAAGVAAATHPWLLLLHADTRLSREWRTVAQIPATHAGYFRFVLDSEDPRARRLERLVGWRNRVLGLPYGDQGLLIHRDLLHAVGGMKPLPLMEDVDLVRRLGRARLVPLAADAVTSARKWEAQGYLRRSARNLLCLSLWFAGVPPALIRRIYE